MGRKISILILSLCLLLGMAPSAAQAADPPPAADEGEAELVLDKWVEDNGDGTFQLVMESYATGSDGTIVPKPTPVDIVLVLDESGSMKDVLVQGCNNKNGIDVHVKPEGHLAQGATAAHPGTELFVGHKVFPEPSDESKKIDTKKSYTIVYPGDGTTRTVTYCQTCGNWYSNEDHNEHYHLAKWIPFTVENETPTNENSGDKTGRWTCHVQFYEQCERTGKEVLQEALRTFLTSLYKNFKPADKEPVHNRVAVIGYGEGVSYISSSGHRDQLVTNYSTEKEYHDFVDGIDTLAANAFSDVSTFDSEAAFAGWVSGVHDTGSTPTQLGILAAEKAFENLQPFGDGLERQKVMILFTDGAPGSGYINFGPGSKLGHPDWVTVGIQAARRMKESGVTVYSAGLFPGADGYGAEHISYDVTKDGKGTTGFFTNANCFLHLVSSNYPHASGVLPDQWGKLSGDYREQLYDKLNAHSYYLATTSNEADKLSEIFEHLSAILSPGSAGVDLHETAVTKDTVTDDFRITYTDGKANVTAYTMRYQGGDMSREDAWEKEDASFSTVADKDAPDKLHIQVDGQNVSVTNFDFAGNYVHMDGSTAKGRKLVIEVTIAPAEGSLGGDNLATNTGRPGVYDPDNPIPVEEFPLPHVDLPTTVTIQKVVRGVTTEEKFDFTVDWQRKQSYDDIEGTAPGDSNHLTMQTTEIKGEAFSLGDGEKYQLENAAVGTALTIRETAPGYTVTVTTGEGSKAYSPDSDGSYRIPVTPGMVVTFTNAVYTVEVRKVDKDTGAPLAGAVFQLEKRVGENSWEQVGDLQKTGADGSVRWTGLGEGTFRVTEVSAPSGYLKVSKPQELTIPANAGDGGVVRVQFENGKAPQTGGGGTLAYTAAGLALLCCAAGVLTLSRKKNRG